MKKTGRPTKFTSERADIILDTLRRGASLAAAAAAAGVNPDTVLNWRRARRVFAIAVERAMAEGALRALDAIWTAAESGDWRAAAWLLERRYPEDYGRQVTDARVQGALTIRIIDESSDRDVDPFAD
ncbi:terminase small subunit-like protein [Roseiflexus sp.]